MIALLNKPVLNHYRNSDSDSEDDSDKSSDWDASSSEEEEDNDEEDLVGMLAFYAADDIEMTKAECNAQWNYKLSDMRSEMNSLERTINQLNDVRS